MDDYNDNIIEYRPKFKLSGNNQKKNDDSHRKQ